MRENNIQMYELCYGNSPSAIMVIEADYKSDNVMHDFKIVYMNDAFCGYIEDKREKYLNESFCKLWGDGAYKIIPKLVDALKNNKKNVRAAVNLGKYQCELHCYMLNDNCFAVTLFQMSVLDNTMFSDKHGYDIDDEKAIENYLRDTELVCRLLADDTETAIWKYDINTATLYRILSGGKVEALPDFCNYMLNAKLIHPDSIDDFKTFFRRVHDGEERMQTDIWLKFYEDKWTCKRMAFWNIFDKDGYVVKSVGWSRDITEDIQIRTEKQMMDMALLNTDLLIWEYDLINHVCIQQHNSMSIYGIEQKSISPQEMCEMGMIAEESYEDFINMHTAVEQGEPWVSADIKTYDADEKVMWQRMSYTTVFNENGKPLRAVGTGTDISEIKKIENAMRGELSDNESKLASGVLGRGVVNITKDSIVYNIASKKIAEDKVRYSYTKLIEEISSFALLEKKQKNIMTKFARNTLIQAYIKGARNASVDYQYKMQDGQVIWVQTAVKMFLDEKSGNIMADIITYDINDKKSLEAVLIKLSELDYEKIAIIDVVLDTITVNTAPRELESEIEKEIWYDYSKIYPDKISGYIKDTELKQAIKLFDPKHLMSVLENKDSLVYSFDTIEPDGKTARKKYQYSYMDESKRFIILAKSDITELFNEQMKQQEILKEALIQAQQASIAKTEFLSRMSHEIRTPMNAIIGMSTLAERCVDNPEQVTDCISKVQVSAQFLLSLINDILNMSRIESGRLVVNKEKIKFEEFIMGINTICFEQAKEKGVEYDCVLDSLTEPYFVCDAMKIQQILINIITNAVKFTPEGGKVKLIITQEKAENGKAFMKFVVWDNGIGISKEFLPKVFNPFEQEDATTTTIYGGTGLGLAICKNLVTLLDGDISVKSQVGEGAEFTVKLQLDIDEAEKEKNCVNRKYPNYKVLVVDDDEVVCRQAKRVLTKFDVKADTAISVTAALEVLEKDNAYDFIFVDFGMSEMNGIEAAKLIKDKIGDKTRIVIMTAYDRVAIENEAKKLNITDFINKPLFGTVFSGFFDKLSDGGRQSKKQNAGPEYDFTGKRILLVEDHILNVEVASRVLMAKGFDIEVAQNGQIAVDKMSESSPGYFDAILMDIRMPVMDGLEATRRIRELRHNDAKTVPIIAMSANAFDEDIAKSKAAGMNAHLAKPIEPKKLYAALHEYIYEHK